MSYHARVDLEQSVFEQLQKVREIGVEQLDQRQSGSVPTALLMKAASRVEGYSPELTRSAAVKLLLRSEIPKVRPADIRGWLSVLFGLEQEHAGLKPPRLRELAAKRANYEYKSFVRRTSRGMSYDGPELKGLRALAAQIVAAYLPLSDEEGDSDSDYQPRAADATSSESDFDPWTVFEENIDPKVRHLSKGRLAWADQIVLQQCPNLTDGWQPSDVAIVKDPTKFLWRTAEERAAYEKWLGDKDPHGTKFRLMSYEGSFLDDPGLRMRAQENSWAEVSYVHSHLAADDERRVKEIEHILTDRFRLADTLCLHLTIATRDGYVMLAQRSDLVFYHPGAWSCSIEEQLAKEDFKYGPDRVMKEWLRRTLDEELSLTHQQCEEADARLSAIFILGDVINIAIAGLVTLNMDRDEFDRHLEFKPKKDAKEFKDWHFFPWSDLARYLVNPDRAFNPSSGLRMLLAGIQKFGVEDFYAQVNSEYRKR